jgi:hypothetical protein
MKSNELTTNGDAGQPENSTFEGSNPSPTTTFAEEF